MLIRIVTFLMFVRASCSVDCSPEKYPFMAYVARARGIAEIPFCTGTVMTPTLVLTSAHCCESRTRVIVGRGTDKQQIRYTRRGYLHSDYDEKATANNICILQLKKALTYNFTYINLTNVREEKNMWEAYKTAKLVLYDKVQKNKMLVCMDVNSVDMKKCGKITGNFSPKMNKDSAVCTSSNLTKGSCQVVVGGPLLTENNVQIGVLIQQESCVPIARPGIYARVDEYLEFINEMYKNTSPSFRLRGSRCIVSHVEVHIFLLMSVKWFIG